MFAYQADLTNWVRNTAEVFKNIKGQIDLHCGGFGGKTVLEYGCSFQLPQGGLYLALALKDGARQCYGVDIPAPSDYDSDPQRVAFWRAARDLLGVPCEGLDLHNRVTFRLYDTLWFDDFVQPLTLLQMSASNLYFRDEMFDLAFSNATMEHVQRPEQVVRELFRVLKPGGFSFMRWNPFTSLAMGGHDLGVPYFFPWAHLRLDEERHVAVLREVFYDPKLAATAYPPPHTPLPEIARERATGDVAKLRREMLADLNQLRARDLVAFAKAAGFEVIDDQWRIGEEDRKYYTPEIASELSEYSYDELVGHTHWLMLRKP